MDTQERADIAPSRHTPVEVPFPEVPEGTKLTLRFQGGACKLNVRPSADPVSALWVSGDYYDPTGGLPLDILREGERVTIAVGRHILDRIELIDGVPELNLTLGNRYAYALVFDAGAIGMKIDLGGLPVTRLEMSSGANATELDFSAPNPAQMSLLKIGVGAGEIKARNLANANFEEMTAGGGAAGIKLDFGGVLQRDGYVNVDAAMAGVELLVPRALPARIVSTIVLGAPKVDEDFAYRDGAYWTPAALEGRTPMLRIHSSVTLGGLALLSR